MLWFWLGLGLATAGPARLSMGAQVGTTVGVSVPGAKNAAWLERLAGGSWMSDKGSTRLEVGKNVAIAHDLWSSSVEEAVADLPARPDLTVGVQILRMRLFTSDTAFYAVVDGEWTVESGWGVVARGRVSGLARADAPHDDALHAAFLVALEQMVATTGFSAAWRETPITAPADLRPITLRACSTPAPSLEEAVRATVVVKADGHIGAGTLVSPDGYVVTAAHVVQDARTVTLRFHDGEEVPAKVVRHRRDADVALLHAEHVPPACLRAGTASPRLASDVYAIGTPTREALAFSIAKGIVSGVREDEGLHLVQTDAAVSPGYSGGPLVDPLGTWVGVLSFKIVARHAEGLTFAVQAADALTALDVTMGPKSVVPTDP